MPKPFPLYCISDGPFNDVISPGKVAFGSRWRNKSWAIQDEIFSCARSLQKQRKIFGLNHPPIDDEHKGQKGCGKLCVDWSLKNGTRHSWLQRASQEYKVTSRVMLWWSWQVVTFFNCTFIIVRVISRWHCFDLYCHLLQNTLPIYAIKPKHDLMFQQFNWNPLYFEKYGTARNMGIYIYIVYIVYMYVYNNPCDIVATVRKYLFNPKEFILCKSYKYFSYFNQIFLT